MRYDGEAIAARVRAAREAAQLSQEDVAHKLSMTAAGYGHYERGRQEFTVPQIFTLSNVLNRSVGWLLGLDTAPFADEEGALLTAYQKILNQETRRMCLEIVTTIAARYQNGSAS